MPSAKSVFAVAVIALVVIGASGVFAALNAIEDSQPDKTPTPTPTPTETPPETTSSPTETGTKTTTSPTETGTKAPTATPTETESSSGDELDFSVQGSPADLSLNNSFEGEAQLGVSDRLYQQQSTALLDQAGNFTAYFQVRVSGGNQTKVVREKVFKVGQNGTAILVKDRLTQTQRFTTRQFTATRFTDENGAFVRSDEAPFDGAVRPASGEQALGTAIMYPIEGTYIRDQNGSVGGLNVTSFVGSVSSGPSSLPALPPQTEKEASIGPSTFAVIVDEQGLIRKAFVSSVYEVDGERRVLTAVWVVKDVGETTVKTPSWVSKASCMATPEVSVVEEAGKEGDGNTVVRVSASTLRDASRVELRIENGEKVASIDSASRFDSAYLADGTKYEVVAISDECTVTVESGTAGSE